MNQDTIKAKLHSIYTTKEDYIVLFAERKSKTVNGLYNVQTKQITLYYKNFIDDSGSLNANALMYTAIHELTHHIIATEKGGHSRQAHNQQFWALFYDLVDIAEQQGIYQAQIDDETQKLIAEARKISAEIATLQRKLGAVLLKIHQCCHAKGIRVEDVIERKVQLTKQSANAAITSAALGISDDNVIGMDMQTAIVRASDDSRDALLYAAETGKTIAQATQESKKVPPSAEKNEIAVLEKKKTKIERDIQHLTVRLEEVIQQLELCKHI